LNNTLKIGKIVKPQGIKGEVKVLPYVDEIEHFSDLKRVYIDGVSVEIQRARVAGQDVFITLKNVTDRNEAETFRGKELSLPLNEARIFNQDGYFIAELVGMDVYVDENKVGVLKEVLKNGAADVFVVSGERPFMVPFLNKLVLEISRENSLIRFDGKVFKEVVLYED